MSRARENRGRRGNMVGKEERRQRDDMLALGHK